MEEEKLLREAGTHLQVAESGYAMVLARLSRVTKTMAVSSAVLAELGTDFHKLYKFHDDLFPSFGQFSQIGRNLHMAAVGYQLVANEVWQ